MISNKRILKVILLVALLYSPFFLFSQDGGLYIPRDIKKAYTNRTRSYDGNPGPNYFQNRVDYKINAIVNPETRELHGKELVSFHNNSSRNLKYIVIRNYHDIFKKGAVRGRPIDSIDAGKEVSIKSILINGKALDLSDPNKIVDRTQTDLILRCITNSGMTSKIEIEWSLTLPEKTHQRFGPIDETSHFVAYWFPQIAVFDDINGWDTFDYNNLNEMYTEFGDYDVSISVPEKFIVWATGVLQNPKEVLSPKIFQRYNLSKNSEKVIKIITTEDLESQIKITQKANNDWIFKADNVSDFAFGLSDHFLWESSSMTLSNGKNVHIHAAFPDTSHNYHEVPEITPWVIKTLSDDILSYAFPFPSMTVFNGLDGMEFPMIVNDDEMSDRAGTYFITAHEVAHSYFPFLVGTNQKRHGWLDEGLTTMLGVETHTLKEKDYNFREIYVDYYPRIAGTQEDVPSIVNSVYLSDLLYQQHEYVRSSLGFWVLKDILGEDLFKSCLKEFIDRWKYKHPSPYDLFFTFNDFSGENLNWFFEPWFLSFAYPDLSIENAELTDNVWNIKIKNIGGMPFPAKLEILYSNNEKKIIEIDARNWKESDTYSISIPENLQVKNFLLNTETYPDSDTSNNYFTPM